ncbi:MAG: molecular chaperone DnaJ [Minisyncoccia bacterium]
MAKDYYATLGIDKSASAGEIKKAFHKLAHQYHPDKNKGDDSKFKEINEAYQTLSDDKKRAQYDQFGPNYADGFAGQGSNGGGFGGQGGGFGGFDFSGFQGQNGANFDMGDLGDIFGEFFGGGGRQREHRGSDLQMSMKLDFKEALFGVEKKVTITQNITCNTCSVIGGKPRTKKKTCNTCKGDGHITETRRSFMGTFQTRATCNTCHGTGKVPEVSCDTCKGAGILRKPDEVTINIPAGIDHGQTLRVSGKGDAIQGGKTGDLYIQISVTTDKNYRREGANLATIIHIPLSDALLGTTYPLVTFDGTVQMKIPEGTTHGETLRVRNHGVPTAHGGRGDILVTIKINFPKSLSKKQKALIAELKEEGL